MIDNGEDFDPRIMWNYFVFSERDVSLEGVGAELWWRLEESLGDDSDAWKVW